MAIPASVLNAVVVGPRVVGAIFFDISVVVWTCDLSPIGTQEHPASCGYLPVLLFPCNQTIFGEKVILIFCHLFAAIHDAGGGNKVFGWYRVNTVVGQVFA